MNMSARKRANLMKVLKGSKPLWHNDLRVLKGFLKRVLFLKGHPNPPHSDPKSTLSSSKHLHK